MTSILRWPVSKRTKDIDAVNRYCFTFFFVSFIRETVSKLKTKRFFSKLFHKTSRLDENHKRSEILLCSYIVSMILRFEVLGEGYFKKKGLSLNSLNTYITWWKESSFKIGLRRIWSFRLKISNFCNWLKQKMADTVAMFLWKKNDRHCCYEKYKEKYKWNR